MNPGRELDTLVAEKVMGWNLTKLEMVEAWIDKQGNWTLKQMWKPSTRIQDAWYIRQWLIDNVGGVEIITTCGDNELVKVWDGQNYIRANAKTTPLALCLASLRTVGVEV